MSLVLALEDFYAEHEYKGSSARTILFYKTNFDHFLKDTCINQLTEFDETTIRKWLISHRHLSPNTLRTYDRSIRVVAAWLYHRGYLPENPMKALPKPKEKHNEIVTLTQLEIKAMLKDAERLQNRLRDRALIMMLLDTGIRIGEACSLCMKDIQWVESFIIVDGKTGQRQIPFGRKVKASLKRYVDEERTASSQRIQTVFLNREGLPFRSTSATQHLCKIANRCNVKASKTGAHIFRHTFAVEFIRAGGDAFTLQRLLGHTTLEMTRRYVHLAQSDLKESHRKFSPGNWLL